MNPLNDRPAVRKVLYLVQWVENGLLAVAGAFFSLSNTSIDALPKWYVLTLGIGPVLWAYLGITAQANVTTPEPEPVEEVEQTDIDLHDPGEPA